jgi:Fur family transcriptional regulator, ferric uptake regulator
MGTRQARAEAERLLAARGVRATPRRVEVLTELVREPNDATAQGLHDRLRRRGKTVGLATVYRTLAVLAEQGIVDVLSHRHGELCYRLCGEGHHHHLVCSGCHRVVELGDCDLDAWLERAVAAHGFRPTEHRLEVTGICADCGAAAVA